MAMSSRPVPAAGGAAAGMCPPGDPSGTGRRAHLEGLALRGLPLSLLLLGWLLMYGPSYHALAQSLWRSDSQGHGPVVLAVGAWLLWRRRAALSALPRHGAPLAAAMSMGLGVVGYVLGRSQTIWTLEIGSQIFVLAALLLAFFGPRGLRVAAFALVFLVFMTPWPGEWVDALTQPFKSAVSAAAAALLHGLGYPIARSGVILAIGPYQLLVADACAGLNSLFTLEALGLLYLNLVAHASVTRNVALAVLVVPISMAANVVRVLSLVLVTYHFGDAAGQGFVHGFAGLVLFVVALVFIVAADGLLGLVARRRRQAVIRGIVA